MAMHENEFYMTTQQWQMMADWHRRRSYADELTAAKRQWHRSVAKKISDRIEKQKNRPWSWSELCEHYKGK